MFPEFGTSGKSAQVATPKREGARSASEERSALLLASASGFLKQPRKFQLESAPDSRRDHTSTACRCLRGGDSASCRACAADVSSVREMWTLQCPSDGAVNSQCGVTEQH